MLALRVCHLSAERRADDYMRDNDTPLHLDSCVPLVRLRQNYRIFYEEGDETFYRSSIAATIEGRRCLCSLAARPCWQI